MIYIQKFQKLAVGKILILFFLKQQDIRIEEN